MNLYSLSFPLNKLIDIADKHQFDLYWKNPNSVCFGQNSAQAERYGDIFYGKSPEEIISDGIVAPEFVKPMVANDKIVLANGATQCFIEESNLANAAHCLSIKSPLFDSANFCVGVLGMSFYFETTTLLNLFSVANTLNLQIDFCKIINFALDPRPHPALSRREVDCANLLIRGKTAKEIGKILGISHRTVEEYIIRIKKKLGCKSKSDLFEAILTQKSYL